MTFRNQASERRYFGSRNIVFWRAKPCRGDILLTNHGQHVFTNLHSCRICCKGQGEFYHCSMAGYLSGMITANGATSLAVGGWKDHVHIFFGMPVTTCISDFMSIVKASSSKWINEQLFIKGKFQWQSGYGAFSHSRSQRDGVINYIMGQQEHHRVRTFKEEYLKILSDYEIPYEEKYLPEFYE
jgi:putative transposase